MRYIRMFSNSLAAGVLATCYILVLVLELNPSLTLSPDDLQPLAATIGQYYLLHLSAAFYVALVARQIFARELFSPAWISVGVLSWLGALAAAAGSALVAANIKTFSLVLPQETVHAMTLHVAVLAVAAIAFAVIVRIRARLDEEGRGPLAVAVAIVAGASVAVPVVIRGGAGPLVADSQVPEDAIVQIQPSENAMLPERTARVTIIALDAGSLDVISSAAAEGRLPNFGRILDSGAVMHMATLHPTSAEAVWTAVATGKLPQRNGVRSAGVYRMAPDSGALRLLPDYCFASGLVRLGFLVEEPHTAASLRARPLWSVLGDHGVESGVINWPLTYPVSPMRGFLVTDRYVQGSLTPLGIDDPKLVYPPDVSIETLPMVRELLESRDVLPDTGSTIDQRHRLPGRVDYIHDQLFRVLAVSRPTQVSIVRFESLDAIGHSFLRYARPETFGDVTEAERRRFGMVLEEQYGFIDEIVGRAIAALDGDDLLVVVSGYGMEPLGLGKRLVERLIGDPEMSGTHEAAPDGFLMLYGASVASGRYLSRASVVDVVPTVLYFLGLPVARDMDGFPHAALFRREFSDEHPITYIPTYEK